LTNSFCCDILKIGQEKGAIILIIDLINAIEYRLHRIAKLELLCEIAETENQSLKGLMTDKESLVTRYGNYLKLKVG
jgi:hypothetical protein